MGALAIRIGLADTVETHQLDVKVSLRRTPLLHN